MSINPDLGVHSLSNPPLSEDEVLIQSEVQNFIHTGFMKYRIVISSTLLGKSGQSHPRNMDTLPRLPWISYLQHFLPFDKKV